MIQPSLNVTQHKTLCKLYLGLCQKSRPERGMRKDGEDVNLSTAVPVVVII